MNQPPAADVLVLLGTDHHRFDRLVRWVEGWLSPREGEAPTVLVQHGFTQPPDPDVARASYAPFLDHREIGRNLDRVAAVVCHGGPGTIHDCRRAGLVPVVVPRSSAHGEHVDDHQIRYTRRLHREGLVRTVDDEQQFRSELLAALERPRAVLTEIDRATVENTVATFRELVATAMQDADAERSRPRIRDWRRLRG